MVIFSKNNSYMFVDVPGNASIEITKLLIVEESRRFNAAEYDGNYFKYVSVHEKETYCRNSFHVFSLILNPIFRFSKFLQSNLSAGGKLVSSENPTTDFDDILFLMRNYHIDDVPNGLKPQWFFLKDWNDHISNYVLMESIEDELPKVFFNIFGSHTLTPNLLNDFAHLNFNKQTEISSKVNLEFILDFYSDDFDFLF